MTEQELQAIEARRKAATGGQWYRIDQIGCEDLVFSRRGQYTDEEITCAPILVLGHYNANREDLDFVVYAPEDIDNLIAEVRRLQNALAQEKAEHWNHHPFD